MVTHIPYYPSLPTSLSSPLTRWTSFMWPCTTMTWSPDGPFFETLTTEPGDSPPFHPYIRTLSPIYTHPFTHILTPIYSYTSIHPLQPSNPSLSYLLSHLPPTSAASCHPVDSVRAGKVVQRACSFTVDFESTSTPFYLLQLSGSWGRER